MKWKKRSRMTTNANGTARPQAVAARLRVPVEEEGADTRRVREDFQQGRKAVSRRSGKTTKSQPVAGESVSEAAFQSLANAALCLVVCPDGEYPRLEVFSAIEGLTERMRELEGEDVTAFPFYGVPLPFTRGPHRFVYLPNGQPYPVFDLSPFGKFVLNPTGKSPIDASYYLGPDSLRDAVPATAVIDHRKADTSKDRVSNQPLPKKADCCAAQGVDSSDSEPTQSARRAAGHSLIYGDVCMQPA
jgi:hypothetical protein